MQFGIETNGNCLINGGCYLLDVKTVNQKMIEFPEMFSLETDFLELMAIQGRVAASVQDCPFIDIGIPEDYRKATQVVGRRSCV